MYERDQYGNLILEPYEETYEVEEPQLVTTDDMDDKINDMDKIDPKRIPRQIKHKTVTQKVTKKRIGKRLKISQDYDPTKKYIPRLERDEWNVIGLVGKTKILKGQPVSPYWIRIKSFNDKFDLWIIR